MFMIAHASGFERAPQRARRRWTDAIDELLAGGELDAESATALRHARAELSDLRTDLSHDDLQRLAGVVRSRRDVAASRALAQTPTR